MRYPDVPISRCSDAEGPLIASWIDALLARHTANLTTSELLKAIRALSVRYVERRMELPRRSAIDSAGKRAAFAAHFAPLHFFTTSALVRALGATPAAVARIVDLGCGTGTASAAWALAFERTPAIVGVDRDVWALEEAKWNWRQLHLSGRTRRASLVEAVSTMSRGFHGERPHVALLLAWSVNELEETDRRRLLPALVAAATAGASVLIIEPLSRAAVPWWDAWARDWIAAGGRADEWKLPLVLPSSLDLLREGAGFSLEPPGARTLWLPGR